MGYFTDNTEPVMEVKQGAKVHFDKVEEVKPVAEPEPTPQPAPATEKTTGSHTNALLNKLKIPRQQAQARPPKDDNKPETDKPETPETPDTPKTDTPPTLLSKDSIEATAGFFTELGDIVFPEVAGLLNDEEPEQYELEPKPKKLVLEAYMRKIEETQQSGTANQQLLMALAVGYGIPIGMGAFYKSLKLIKEWKDKRNAPPPQVIQQPVQQVQPVAPQQVAPQTAPAPATNNESEVIVHPAVPIEQTAVQVEQTAQQEVEPQTVDITPTTDNKQCLFEGCDQLFAKGMGYGKTKGKVSYDLFHSATCMNKHNGSKAKKTG